MRQKLLRRRPLRGIPHQHPVEETLQPRRHFVAVLQLGRRHFSDPPHGLQGRLVKERRFPVHHLYHHYPQRPDVHFRPVRQPTDHFRRHPVRRPHQRLPLGQLLRHLGAEPEVGQFDSAVEGQQDRVGFDVAVDDALRVQVGERLEALLADGGDLFLVHPRVGDDVGEGPALQELHHHPELVVHQVTVEHLDHVGVVVVAHYHHLVEQELPALLLAQVHLLHGDLTAGVAVVRYAHRPRGTLADFDETFEILAGVLRRHHHLEGGAELKKLSSKSQLPTTYTTAINTIFYDRY
jgi:hypothetical protein